MDYQEIKDKISGWLKDKEGFNDKDLYFLFKDLCEESWEAVRGEGEELTEELDDTVDPDSLEAYGEEPEEEEKDEGKDEDEDDEDEDDEDELPVFKDIKKEEPKPKPKTKVEAEPEIKPIYSKKPRVKTT